MRAAEKAANWQSARTGSSNSLLLAILRFGDPLVLVEGRDAAGIVADHHVRLGFLDRDLNLAVDGERARELTLRDDVAEAKAAAVVPSLSSR